MTNSPETLRLGDRPPSDRVFLLGQFCQRVTLRAQQTRALNLAVGLADRLGPTTRVAVVGGGVGGLTCLAGLLEWTRVGRVDLYEKSDALLPLQRHCKTRYLHPFAADWPGVDIACPEARLPLLNWRAGFADDVARQIEREWDLLRGDHPGERYAVRRGVGYDVRAVEPAPGGCVAVHIGNGVVEYDYVVVASGFGAERQLDGPTSPLYWENDSLDQQVRRNWRPGVQRVYVSGCGDGGLIDVLRSLLFDSWHDVLLRLCLETVPAGTRSNLAALEASLASMVARTRGDARNLPPDFAANFTRDFRALEARELDQRLREKLRSDRTVVLVGSLPDPCLNSAAFAMNRFLVSRLMGLSGNPLEGSLTYRTGRTEYSAARRAFVLRADGAEEPVEAEMVFIRHGPSIGDQPVLDSLRRFDGFDLGAYTRRVSAHVWGQEWDGRDLPSRVNLAATPEFRDIHALYTQWLRHSAEATQLIEEADRLRGHYIAESPDATYAFRARVLLFLAERYVNTRKPGEAQRCIDQCLEYTGQLDQHLYRPYVTQLRLDALWLKSITLKLDEYHDEAVREAEAARNQAAALLDQANPVLCSQLTLQLYRLDRSLITFLAEAGRIPEAASWARRLLHGPEYGLGEQWGRVKAEHVAMTYALPQDTAELLLKFEAFQILRRVFTFWVELGDLRSCHLLLPRFITAFREVKASQAMDYTTRLHFLRLLSHCLAIQSIGTSERRAVVELARTGFAAAKVGFIVLGFQQKQEYIERDRVMAHHVRGVRLDDVRRVEYDEFAQKAQRALTMVHPDVPGRTTLIWRRAEGAVPLRVHFIRHARILVVVDGRGVEPRAKGLVGHVQQTAEEIVAELTDCEPHELTQDALARAATRALRYVEGTLRVPTASLGLGLTAPDPGRAGSLFLLYNKVTLFTVQQDGRLRRRRPGHRADGPYRFIQGRLDQKPCIVGVGAVPPLRHGASVIEWNESEHTLSMGGRTIRLDNEFETWDWDEAPAVV